MNKLESMITSHADYGQVRTAYNFSFIGLSVAYYGLKTIIEASVFRRPPKTVYMNTPILFKHSLNFFGVKVEAEGLENVVNGPGIVCQNHTSQFDILALSVIPNTRMYFVTKRELFDIPLLGAAMKAAGMPLIDRQNKDQAISVLDRAAEMMKDEKYGKDSYLVIFPEGTRTKDRDYKMLPFKKGAFATSINSGLPIIPIASYGGIEILPKGSMKPKPGKIHLKILEPVYPSAYSYQGISEEQKKVAINDMLNDTRYKIETQIALIRLGHFG